MVAERVDVFTGMQRNDFNAAWAAVSQAPAPWEAYTSVVPSGVRIEHLNWLSPSPGMSEYLGQRELGLLSNYTYKLTNVEYSGGYEVPTRDIEDAQTGGYASKPGELAQSARDWPGELSLAALAANGNTMDGSPMFNATHGIGVGNNILSYDPAGTDAVAHRIIFMFHGSALKPLIYLDRKPPKLQDDGGTKESEFRKKVRFWADMEGVCGYGWWFNAVRVDLTDTPTLAECETILGNIVNAFRGFKLPKGSSRDVNKYPHQNTMFTAANSTLVCSGTGIEYKFRSVMVRSPLAVVNTSVTGQFLDMANVVVANQINP